MSTPQDRVHACLDGELTRDALSPAEQQQLDALTESVGAAVGTLRAVRVPDLTARVMAALPADEAEAAIQTVGSAAPTTPAGAGDGLLAGALRWLWSPRPIAVRPVYAFAGAGVLALLLVLASRQEPAAERTAGPQRIQPAAVVATTQPMADGAELYVQFRIEIPGASRVAVAGSFTDWRPQYELTEVSPGVWSAMVPLSPGVHDYTFVVDGKRMVIDPYAPRVSDSFGGSNSRLFLPAPNGSA